MDPRTDLDNLHKIKISSPRRDPNPDRPARSLVIIMSTGIYQHLEKGCHHVSEYTAPTHAETSAKHEESQVGGFSERGYEPCISQEQDVYGIIVTLTSLTSVTDTCSQSIC